MPGKERRVYTESEVVGWGEAWCGKKGPKCPVRAAGSGSQTTRSLQKSPQCFLILQFYHATIKFIFYLFSKSSFESMKGCLLSPESNESTHSWRACGLTLWSTCVCCRVTACVWRSQAVGLGTQVSPLVDVAFIPSAFAAVRVYCSRAGHRSVDCSLQSWGKHRNLAWPAVSRAAPGYGSPLLSGITAAVSASVRCASL